MSSFYLHFTLIKYPLIYIFIYLIIGTLKLTGIEGENYFPKKEINTKEEVQFQNEED